MFSFRNESKRVKLLLTNDWLSGLFALGLSTIGSEDGSYASFVSSAKMLLFLTRLACLSFSILERRWDELSDGDGERGSGVFSLSKREGDMSFLDDQKSRVEGESLFKSDGGGEFSVKEFSVYGEDSRDTICF